MTRTGVLMTHFQLIFCLFAILLRASNVNQKLYSKYDYGCSHLTKMVNKYEAVDKFTPPPNLMKDAYTIPGDDEVYWLPESKDTALFDVVDLESVLVPVLSSKHPVYENFFTFALLAQYIIPSWLEELTLSNRDIDLIRTIAPFITTRLRKYFQHVIWAVFFQTGQVSRGSSELMSSLNTHMTNLGFIMKDLPMIVLNTAHYKKVAITAPFRNVLAVAKHWDMNLKAIAKEMHFKLGKGDAHMLKDQESGPTCREVLLSILPKVTELVPCQGPLTIRLPRTAIDAILLNNVEDTDMPSEESDHVMTRGQKRKAEARISSPPSSKRARKTEIFEVPPVIAVAPGPEATTVDETGPSLEDAAIFSEFIQRVHHQHFLETHRPVFNLPPLQLPRPMAPGPMSLPMYLKFKLEQKRNK